MIEIDPWLAIGFAVEHIEDHYDRLDFLKAVLEGDFTALTEDYPEFAGVQV